MKSIEFEFLLNFLVSKMEEKGLVITNFTFSLDKEFVDECNKFCDTNSDMDKYHEILKHCITHEYIRNMTADPFGCIAITQKGVGIVASNRRVKQNKDCRTNLKKLSDFVEEHKGISILSAFIFSTISLIISILTFFFKK